MAKTGPVKIEMLDVPRQFFDWAVARVRPFVRHRLGQAAHFGPLDVEKLAAESYAQGLWDGLECAKKRPQVLEYVDG